eukprot:4070074-Pleurochrysis_carterae.AAC.2
MVVALNLSERNVDELRNLTGRRCDWNGAQSLRMSSYPTLVRSILTVPTAAPDLSWHHSRPLACAAT